LTDLYALGQQEYGEDVEFEILPATARIAVKGPTAALSTLLQRAALVAPTKATVPNTEWLQLEAIGAAGGRLAFVRSSAFDGAVTMSTQDDSLEVLREGSVLLPRKVADVVKLAPEDTISLTVLGSSCVVRSGRAQWTIATPVGDALPPRPDTTGLEMHPIPRVPFIRALRVARLAISSGGSRAALQQALVRDGKITASDAGRLHQSRVSGLPEDLTLTIPVRLMDEIIRAGLDSQEETIFLGGDNFKVACTIGLDEIVGQRQLVGYPNVESLVLQPAFTNDASLTVSSAELIDAVKRARVNADPTTSAVTLEVVPGGSGWLLMVTTIDRDGNSSKEPLNAVWEGPKKGGSFTVQHKSLLELIAGAARPEMTFRVSPGSKTKRFPLLVETESFVGVLQQVLLL
jgi:DNA polymerase III sliding clamp (beta) subunit (PCNA family)